MAITHKAMKSYLRLHPCEICGRLSRRNMVLWSTDDHADALRIQGVVTSPNAPSMVNMEICQSCIMDLQKHFFAQQTKFKANRV